MNAQAENDHWVHFSPDGCAQSSSYVAEVGPLAEDAYKRIVPKVADRRREAAEGWTIERLSKAAWRERAKPCFRGQCTHQAATSGSDTELRGLTVKQPWAWALLNGKNVENRSWPAPNALIGTTVLLHAGKEIDGHALQDPRVLALPGLPARGDLVTGAILAVARLAGSHLEQDGCCTPWGDPQTYHWQFADLRVLEEPITCTGALNLWRPPPGLDTSNLIRTKEAEHGHAHQH